jgi:hypothetical protein
MSGYTGVSPLKSGKGWVAKIGVKKKEISLKFDTAEAAAAAYNYGNQVKDHLTAQFKAQQKTDDFGIGMQMHRLERNDVDDAILTDQDRRRIEDAVSEAFDITLGKKMAKEIFPDKKEADLWLDDDDHDMYEESNNMDDTDHGVEMLRQFVREIPPGSAVPRPKNREERSSPDSGSTDFTDPGSEASTTNAHRDKRRKKT